MDSFLKDLYTSKVVEIKRRQLTCLCGKRTIKNLMGYSLFDLDCLELGERNLRNFESKEHLVIQLKSQLVWMLYKWQQAQLPSFDFNLDRLAILDSVYIGFFFLFVFFFPLFSVRNLLPVYLSLAQFSLFNEFYI